nr:hypothetical protein [Clostridia bacterium]
MMNKRSSRLIAWLLAMVMILNIVPVTAFADYSNSLTQPVGKAAEITVHYVSKSNGAKDSWNFKWDRQGNERTPTQTDAFWSYSGSLAGWSTVSDYTDRNSGLLFAPGSYIDFSMFPNSAVPREITLYETAAIPVTVNVNGKINGQEVSTLYAVPGEKLEKPADPIPYDTHNNGSFKEWLKDDGTVYDFDTIVTAPFTLIASYRTAGSTHTVHFQYNNGTPEVTVTVNDGAKVQRPTDPVVPSSWSQVFDFWAINGQNVPYDFDTPVTRDLWIGAVYKNAGSDNNNNSGSGNNNNSGSGNVSNETTEFVIQYLIAGDHNYVNQGEDIEFDRKTVTGVPSEYYNDNNKTRIADSKKQVYTNDTDPQSKVWDEESKTLKLYYSPITLTITLHYRRILTDTTAENLDQTDGGKKHGYSGHVNPTYDSYNNTKLITALPQFNITYAWIDVDPE